MKNYLNNLFKAKIIITIKNNMSNKKNGNNPPDERIPRRYRKRVISNDEEKPKKSKYDDDDEDDSAAVFMRFIMTNNNEDDVFPKPKSKNTIMQEKIMKSGMSAKNKETAIIRLKSIEADKQKGTEWIESLLRIPFGKYEPLPVSMSLSSKEIKDYFDFVQKSLDDAVYGMNVIKEEIINYVAQIISTENKAQPRIIGLCGSPGIGKTAIIRKGLSKALKRPMKCISMGGIRDSSHFVGFDYTYSGSRYGAIVQSLIDTDVMNPILFFDELDKVSQTNDGQEIINLLIHITDPIQNNDFQDKYFSGFQIDISKAILIFSYNDESLLNPILKDRIHSITVPNPTEQEKIVIGIKYLVKEIGNNLGFKSDDIIFSEEIMKFMIKEYCKKDKGVRGLKRIIETIMMKINTERFTLTHKYKSIPKEITFPFTITKSIIEEMIKIKKEEEWISHSSMYM
jgi:ATP-dependent Lon protease